MTTSDVYVVVMTSCDITMSCYQTYCKCKDILNYSFLVDLKIHVFRCYNSIIMLLFSIATCLIPYCKQC